jgi:hypothetical protein
MSVYGHFNKQYDGHKIQFPKESFLIAGISYYQNNLTNINFDSKITMKLEPKNKYDSNAIQLLYNNNCIGYVPNNEYIKGICRENIDNELKIIVIKKEPENQNYGIRVILDKFFTKDLKDIALF